MVDGFGRSITYLRVSVTELCNLRCRYCMPAEGVQKKRHDEMMTEDETIAVIRAAAGLGISKVRITGGEPLVKKNILSICRRAAAVPGVTEVCLTTNGVLLPALAKPLREAGVRRVNVSLDALDPDVYRAITRIGSLESALSGLYAALDAGFEKVKVNAVLIGGVNEREIPALAALTRERDLDVRFIELMPMVDGGFGPDAFLSADAVLRALPSLVPLPPDGGVARLYRLPDGKGRVGLISPVSTHFCGTCNRLRLTADGKLKPCLHAPEEFSIRGLDEAGIREAILRAVRAKPERHGALFGGARSKAGRNMNEIGG